MRSKIDPKVSNCDKDSETLCNVLTTSPFLSFTDIIISGGENISSIEVQDILATHPGVLEAAVVAMPDEKWGEVPCAFVARDPAAPEVTEAELIAWARTKMAHFQAPKRVIFGELLKTATGKVQKHLLRKLL